MIGVFGGAFDPPHNGHVALLRAAKSALGLERVRVLVVAEPGHKSVQTPPAVRLELARAAFPGEDVLLEEHARTVDTLRAHPEWDDPVLLLGADELAGFLDWKEPGEVLRRARLAVAARPGFPQDRLGPVLEQLGQPDRVLFFELDQPQASRAIRAGADLAAAVPAAVAGIIERDGLYGRSPRYTEPA